MSCYPLQVVSRMVMNRSGEVFYIGGNDVLPAPLEPKREAFILQKLGTGQEEEAKSVLIEHNLMGKRGQNIYRQSPWLWVAQPQNL